MDKITMVYYIENLGDQTLGDELSRLENDGANVTPHPQMACLNRRGIPQKRDLYEVPVDVRDRIIRMAKTAGYTYAIYSRNRAVVGSQPKEFIAQIVPARVDLFKVARARRRRLGKLPAGVVRGSSLVKRPVGV